MQSSSKIPYLYSFIDGKYQQESDSIKSRIDIINPALAEPVYKAEIADQNTVEFAIESAQAGFNEWSAVEPVQRGRILLKAANILRERNNELALLESTNTGKPIQESLAVDIHSGADCIEYFAGLADKLEGKTINNRTNFIYTLREPLGVCLGIGAWNYPLQIACWKAAPALAAGNAMIFKPSELTPITALKLAEIFIEAGVPKGVFNVVLGDSSTGQLLTSHPQIAKVSVTGSVATGKKVMSSASSTLKSVTMELGGKSPLIILDDADLDEAVNAAMLANFYTQGEICSNGTRVFVQESIHDAFVEKIVAKTKDLVIGNPLEQNTQIGSLISQSHLDKVLTFIDIGKQEGAKLVCGGSRVENGSCKNGYYVAPTIFTDCKDAMQIVTEEIFGPVMSVLKFSTIEEVISRANNTQFGLAAGLITQDLRKAHTIIPKLEAGTCWINNYNVTPIAMQFGGFKQSGIGFENGMDAINQYTKSKSIYLELDKVDSPY